MFPRGTFGTRILKLENNPRTNPMTCQICKVGTMEKGRVTVTLERGERIIVIKNVPAKVCDNCGEYVLEESVTNELMDLAGQAIAKNAEIEVLQYAA